MKKFYALVCTVLLTVSMVAQAPQKMSYQAVIRNSSDALVTSTTIGMKISILQGSESGTAVYVETQTPSTNSNGLVTIEIGGGTVVSGTVAGIDWSAGPYYIKTEIATAAPLTTYTITATSQLLSVPYALAAKTAESVTETDPVFIAWDKSTGISITASQVSDFETSVTNNAAVVANTAKETNATHTGDATGATALTVKGINGTLLSGLATGILKNTTSTGVPSIAIAADFPTLNQNTSGSAASFTGSLVGEVTGTQGATVIANKVTMTGTLPISVSGSPTVIASAPVAITIAPATTTTAGSMSATDKVKLDALTTTGHYLGESYLGGVIFNVYIGSDGTQHGLIVAATETGASTTIWGPSATSTGATSLWDGATNTTKMTASTAIQSYLTGLPATTGVWYVPSEDELLLLRSNLFFANKGLSVVSGTLIGLNDYWSSTEIDVDDATSCFFADGKIYTGAKSGLGDIRAIKAF